VYGPLAPDATTKDADTFPALDIAHAELAKRLAGSDESVHVVSAEAKFDPVTRTLTPARPEVGDKATVAVTVNGTVIEPCWTSEPMLLLIVI